jgi:hypothetical protein
MGVESPKNLSGLESLRRPPGTGRPPRHPLAEDLGLGDDHRGALFVDELRRAERPAAVAQRAEAAASHSDRLAERRTDGGGPSPRPEGERPAAPPARRARRSAGEEALGVPPAPRSLPADEPPPRIAGGAELSPPTNAEAAPAPGTPPPPTPVGPPEALGTGPAPQAPPPGPALPSAALPSAALPASRTESPRGAALPGAGTAGRTRPTGPASAPAAPEAPADLERAAEVLAQLRAALRPGLRQAVVRLDPAELGAVTIRLGVGRAGVQGRIEVESEGTRALLERHLPELRAALAQTGLEVGSLELSLSDGRGPSGDPRPEPQPAAPDRRSRPAPETTAPAPRSAAPARDPSGVDFYA